VESILQDAGGLAPKANTKQINLYIPEQNSSLTPQKIDINRAEAWLLEALPGIGQTLAQRIVDYRQKNGPFKNTAEITKVEGISNSVYSEIKELITVSE